MEKYWITNDLAVDRDTERELANNGAYADARVRLVSACDEAGISHYYLQTNGGPVVLIESNIDHNRDWLDTLGLTAAEAIAVIAVDGRSEDQEWACSQLREVEKEDEE